MKDVYRRTIALRLDAGADLGEVEAELIEQVLGLSHDDRAALWLFARAYHENADRTGHPQTEVVI
jgi:cytochrome c-type biogenesis protein CcmH/NrfG